MNMWGESISIKIILWFMWQIICNLGSAISLPYSTSLGPKVYTRTGDQGIWNSWEQWCEILMMSRSLVGSNWTGVLFGKILLSLNVARSLIEVMTLSYTSRPNLFQFFYMVKHQIKKHWYVDCYVHLQLPCLDPNLPMFVYSLYIPPCYFGPMVVLLFCYYELDQPFFFSLQSWKTTISIRLVSM